MQLRGEIDLKSDALGCRRGGSRYNFVETLREERNGGTDGNIITRSMTLVSPLPIGLSISAHVVSE